MPEGPEVTIIANSLDIYVSGKTLTKLEVLSGRYLSNPLANIEKIINAKITSISNKGKFIYWIFDNDSILFSTLGMSGGYTKLPEAHTRIRFVFDNESILCYNDVRSFGTLKITDKEELDKKLKEIGPDMLNKSCSIDEFRKIIKKYPNKILGEFLMDQKRVSGIGNIYKSEICYSSKLMPRRTLSSLSDLEITSLYHSILEILKVSFSLGGSSQKDFKDISGKLGNYLLEYSQVYRRTSDRLGNPVQKLALNDGRTTWWCPDVQK